MSEVRILIDDEEVLRSEYKDNVVYFWTIGSVVAREDLRDKGGPAIFVLEDGSSIALYSVTRDVKVFNKDGEEEG